MPKRELFRGSTVSVGSMSRILVIAHGRETPSREDWTEVCKQILDNYRDARGQLVLSLGGAPNAAQRKAAIDQLPKTFVPPPAAVLTDVLAVRGIVTALNWLLNDNHRAFKPTDAVGVAKHLHILDKEAADLIAFARGLVPI